MGTRLDSVGDDLTVLVGVIGLLFLKWEFIKDQKLWFIILLSLFLVQVIYAFTRYRKMTSFHTWFAKTAALFQGVFLILVFFTKEPNMILFYAAIFITMLELIEEIILVGMLPEWETNVKGIWWAMKKRKQ